MFKWTDSLITGKDRDRLKDTIVGFNDIFARRRLDIGMNTQFKVSLTPQDDKPVYTQSLPVPINLKGDLIVELALMHRYGIIKTLAFSKYASPIFAQRKPNGKLRLLVDLRKINALIAGDYINNNYHVSTLSDAAQHLAGTKLFCKLDCSQAYRCLQMADQMSVELLAFNFAWHKDSVEHYQQFQASCVSTWTRSSKQIGVQNMLTILELPQTQRDSS